MLKKYNKIAFIFLFISVISSCTQEDKYSGVNTINITDEIQDLPLISSSLNDTVKIFEDTDISTIKDSLTKIKEEYFLLSDFNSSLDIEKQQKANLAWLSVDRISKAEQIIGVAKDIRNSFKTVVVLGIGGSDLGARSLLHALSDNFYDFANNKTKIIFAGDNTNGNEIEKLVNNIDVASTCVIVISKSGRTAETMSNFFVVLEYFSKTLPENQVLDHFIAISSNKNTSCLKQYHEEEKFRHFLEIEDGIPGRFSVLSPVGLLPAAIAGIDINKLLTGAKEAQKSAFLDTSNLSNDLATNFACYNHLAYNEMNLPILGFFPFDGRLAYFSKWFRQLWSESIGKQQKGSTPLALVGTTDNHSIQQLILDGERNKFIVLLGVKRQNTSLIINVPDNESFSRLEYLDNVKFSDLLYAQLNATENTYIDQEIPYLRIELNSVDEFHIGAMIMQLELATAWSCELINVNPFIQPAVESIKIYTKENLIK